jgi:nucleoside-diphosphate-sugar epimerase
VKTEEDPIDPDPPRTARQSMAAIAHLEAAVTTAAHVEGLVLRYGGFYGPGTGMDRQGPQAEMIRRRMFPIVGRGDGIWSFSQIEDAADATAAAVTQGPPGLYNVVDDEPAPVRDWLPYLADALGAPPPRHLPAWLARPLIGGVLFRMMTTARGSSNAKAKRELDWSPTYASWRQGFVDGLG